MNKEIKRYVITEEVGSYDSKSDFMVKLIEKFRDRIDKKTEEAFKKCRKTLTDAILPSYDREFYQEFTNCFQEALKEDYYGGGLSVVDKNETTLQRKVDGFVDELKSLAYNFDELFKCMEHVQISADIRTTNYISKKIDDIKIVLENYKGDKSF